jgi:predicted ATPase with chaperone activity
MAACDQFPACYRWPSAREKKIPNLILPAANAAEAAVVEGVNVFPVASLLDVIDLLNSTIVGSIPREPFHVKTEELLGELQHFSLDFKDVRGKGPPSAPSKLCGAEPQHPVDRAAGVR